jgi:hypothetical protein
MNPVSLSRINTLRCGRTTLDHGYDLHYNSNQHHLTVPRESSHPNSRTIGGGRLTLQALKLLRLPELLYTLEFPEKQIISPMY